MGRVPTPRPITPLRSFTGLCDLCGFYRRRWRRRGGTTLVCGSECERGSEPSRMSRPKFPVRTGSHSPVPDPYPHRPRLESPAVSGHPSTASVTGPSARVPTTGRPSAARGSRTPCRPLSVPVSSRESFPLPRGPDPRFRCFRVLFRLTSGSPARAWPRTKPGPTRVGTTPVIAETT